METPILIPSFSCKGLRVDGDGKSEVRELLEFTSEWLTESPSTRLLANFECKTMHNPYVEGWLWARRRPRPRRNDS